jgi:hypothetical protein
VSNLSFPTLASDVDILATPRRRVDGMQQSVNIQAEIESRKLRAVLVVREASRTFRCGEDTRVREQKRGYTINDVERGGALHESRNWEGHCRGGRWLQA